MIKRVIVIIVFMAFLFSMPLLAEEQLMTKHFFDNWLPAATKPVEQQIDQLKTAISEMDRAVREMRSSLTTEIKVVIGQTKAWIDGNVAVLDVAPVINNNRTMVPVRFIGECMGAEFAWDGNTRKVTYTLNSLTIELYIDKKTAKVRGKEVALDAPPFIIEGRTMVPLRFVGQYMEASFEWDSANQTVTIFR
ncbi:MAG: hypothetical protein CVU87_03165 [Firmicutes bacterium HGW-Firmicutes-12]|jgi:hypothetical protein|nr:MAG: hypothetical protein CVU87_03165 [Firmicutes bacterium HGW-Firmicutes-12]